MDITCQKCGTVNRLGTMFCRECGAKLDLNSMDPSKKARSSVNIGSLVGRLVRLTIVLVLIVVLVLLCWGPKAPGDAASANGTQVVLAKMTALRGAVLRKVEVIESVSEADINAYVNGRLVNAAGGSGALKMTLEDVSIDFQDDKVIAWMNTKLGPIPITYMAEASLTRGSGGRLDFESGPVSIGRITMPGPLRGRVIDQFVAVFTKFQDENVLLSRLAYVRPVDGALELGTVTK